MEIRTMPIDSKTAVSQLREANPVLDDAVTKLCIEWEPDPPPLTLIMSALGRSMATYLSGWRETERQTVLGLLERYLSEGEDRLKNAIATGLLEAVLNECSAGRFDFREIAPALGPETTRYCKEWDKFTGVATRGLE